MPVFLTTSWSLILGNEGVNASSTWRPLLRLFVNVTLDNVPPNETLSSLYSTMIQVKEMYVKKKVF
jgi:hypothetical protein